MAKDKVTYTNEGAGRVAYTLPRPAADLLGAGFAFPASRLEDVQIPPPRDGFLWVVDPGRPYLAFKCEEDRSVHAAWARLRAALRALGREVSKALWLDRLVSRLAAVLPPDRPRNRP